MKIKLLIYVLGIIAILGCRTSEFDKYGLLEQERLIKEKYSRNMWIKFLDPQRDKLIQPEKVIERLAIDQGDILGDIGAGAGYFTFRLARAVGPDGFVYAVDIQPEGLVFIQERMGDRAENPYNNVRCVVNQPNNVGLPEGILDLAFLCNVHFYRYRKLTKTNQDMIESLFRSVKPGGRLAVIEKKYRRLETSEGTIRTNFERSGFHFVKSIDLIRSQYFLIFRKPAQQ